MNSMIPNPSRLKTRIPHRNASRARAVGIFSAAALLLAPHLPAQTEAAEPAAPHEAAAGAIRLYSMSFRGGNVEALERDLRAAFPKDNIVITPTGKYIELNLGPFEIRDVRLKELAKTIEFLSDGKLVVEVTEMEEGSASNTWRITNRLGTIPPSVLQLKIRSVAAPGLFSEGKAERVKKDAEEMEGKRILRTSHAGRLATNDALGAARVELLPEQNMFVIVGTEDGIAGMESFITAAEQLAADQDAKKQALAASLAPTMRAVLAPHLFRSQDRVDHITEEFGNMQDELRVTRAELMKAIGIDHPLGDVRIQQRHDQKLFLLVGSERDIAGMESVIQAAEKDAADQDATDPDMIAAMAFREAEIRRVKEKVAEELKKNQ